MRRRFQKKNHFQKKNDFRNPDLNFSKMCAGFSKSWAKLSNKNFRFEIFRSDRCRAKSKNIGRFFCNVNPKCFGHFFESRHFSCKKLSKILKSQHVMQSRTFGIFDFEKSNHRFSEFRWFSILVDIFWLSRKPHQKVRSRVFDSHLTETGRKCFDRAKILHVSPPGRALSIATIRRPYKATLHVQIK